jgi:hypothetical protein
MKRREVDSDRDTINRKEVRNRITKMERGRLTTN